MANATFLYAGTEDGLLITTRPGTSKEWLEGRHAIEAGAVSALARGETFPVRLLAAVEGRGVLRSANGGRTWEPVLTEPVSLLAADPRNLELVFAAGAGEVFRSLDGGASWEQAALPAGGAALSMVVTRDATDGRSAAIWLGLENGAVYSRDGGDSWHSAGAGPLGDTPVYSLVSASASEATVFAATGTRLCRLRLAGDALSQELVEGETPSGIRHLLLLGMIDKPGATALLAATGNGMLWHGDGEGPGWALLNGAAGSELGMDDAVTALAAHPEYPGRAYLGTSSGALFETTNRGRRWQSLDVAAGSTVRTLLAAVLK